MKVVGVDEAGKGPVIGPMLLCAVKCDFKEKDLKKKPPSLKNINVKDSKKTSFKERKSIARQIKQRSIKIVSLRIDPPHIDELRKIMNMNEIMVNSYLRILEKVEFDKAILDAADVNSDRFGERIKEKLGNNKEIISKHKADEKFPIVSAASILAKVKRDKKINQLEKNFDIEIGTGYPHDKKTRNFLRNYFEGNGSFPIFVRRSWNTTKKVKKAVQQTNIYDFD
ncbi:MAG: Ribonuclease HII [Candidatus Methanohalarchaeum thermophilum]|uniref:Ribonuclease HII n=1 Tax=Methanohalarchaeum thermophilum TaxID=1903181 RepID=A0A1Q6DW65_METT1|nr:MAG: Ribonuclease HII [Candidatus Methanohalarchaeum thermophilum]